MDNPGSAVDPNNGSNTAPKSLSPGRAAPESASLDEIPNFLNEKTCHFKIVLSRRRPN